jgi:hypothetical protein
VLTDSDGIMTAHTTEDLPIESRTTRGKALVKQLKAGRSIAAVYEYISAVDQSAVTIAQAEAQAAASNTPAEPVRLTDTKKGKK